MTKKIHSRPCGPPPGQLPKLTPEEELQLDYDICCCVEELENLLTKNITEKQKKLAEVSLKILKNPGESHVRKKQVMRQQFGDYRNKFDSKKKQVISKLSDNPASFKPVDTPNKSIFIRKHKVITETRNPNQNTPSGDNSELINGECSEQHNSSFQPSDNSFRFNF